MAGERMRVIWKYPVDYPASLWSALMPPGADVLHVAMQNGAPMLWAIVDPDVPKAQHEMRRFCIVLAACEPELPPSSPASTPARRAARE